MAVEIAKRAGAAAVLRFDTSFTKYKSIVDEDVAAVWGVVRFETQGEGDWSVVSSEFIVRGEARRGFFVAVLEVYDSGEAPGDRATIDIDVTLVVQNCFTCCRGGHDDNNDYHGDESAERCCNEEEQQDAWRSLASFGEVTGVAVEVLGVHCFSLTRSCALRSTLASVPG